MQMMKFITQRGECYKVDLKTGNMSQNNFPFSGGWKFVCFKMFNKGAFIHLSDIQNNPKIIEEVSRDWRFKNGSGKYVVRDLDHGTLRQWSERVSNVWIEN